MISGVPLDKEGEEISNVVPATKSKKESLKLKNTEWMQVGKW